MAEMTSSAPSNIQYPMLVTFTGSTTSIAAGMKIKAYNRNNKETITADLIAGGKGGTAYEAVLDAGNFKTAVDTGDVIELKIEGAGFVNGSTTHTVALTSGGADISITIAAESTSMSSISI